MVVVVVAVLKSPPKLWPALRLQPSPH